MIAWVFAAALAASKWDGQDPDIVAEATLSAPQSQIYAVLLDDHVMERILPEACASDFDYEGVKDPKATVRFTYDVAGMHRRLDSLHSRSEPERLVEIEHLGNKGFYTRFALSPTGGNTKVVMTTYLNPPPWPFKKYFYTTVRPVWVQCQTDALKRLDVEAAQPAP